MQSCRNSVLAPLAVLTAVLFATNSLFASDEQVGSSGFTKSKLKQIEENLICALESDSPGLQASAAQVMRDTKARAPEYDFSRSIVPLLRILKDDDQDSGVRQIVALTLHELGSARGDYAIEREAKYSQNRQLKHLCAWLTYARRYGDVAAMSASNSPELLSLQHKDGTTAPPTD